MMRSAKGLGTPSTRAATIEKLVQKGFIERKGDKKTKYLVPTNRGISLITVIPEILQSPSLTADWEQRLLLIERGQYDPAAFMREIEEMISSLVSTYEVVKGAEVLTAGKKIIGNSVYHICQYAEILEQNGGRCEPEPETLLDKATWQLGHRDFLLVERTENGFRYELVTKEFLSRAQGRLDLKDLTMNQAREHILDTFGMGSRSRAAVSIDSVRARMQEVLKASDVTKIEWQDSRYFPGMRTAEHDLTCEIRAMEAAGYTLDTIESTDGHLRFFGEGGQTMTMAGWQEC